MKTYKNRQVVVNYYENEELVNKDGFNIDSIELAEHKLIFIRKSKAIFSISLIEFPNFKILEDFKNYFSLSNGSRDVEIYFP